MDARDRAVALATVRPRADCPHCNPPPKEPTMDPDSCLAAMRDEAALVIKTADDETTDPPMPGHAVHLAELVQSLDQWISHGGFYPTQWPAPAGLHAPPF